MLLSSPAMGNEKAYFSYLENMYKEQNKKLYTYLIEEFERYRNRFPASSYLEQSQFYIANLHFAEKKEQLALASYLKVLYLYPNSPHRPRCIEHIGILLRDESSLKKNSLSIEAKLRQNFANGTDADRYYKFLTFIETLDQKKLHFYLVREAANFVALHPTDSRVDQILNIAAQIYYDAGKHNESAAAYTKLSFLTPGSPLLPHSQYKTGTILYKKLDRYEDAEVIYAGVIKDFQDDQYAGNAMFMLGEIKEKKRKNYEAAIAQYRQMIESYPQNSNAPLALWRIAKISSKRLDDISKAILTYNEIIKRYPESDLLVSALEENSGLYQKKLKDYEKAAEFLARSAKLIPKHKKTPDMILRAGIIAEDRIEDYALAATYYKMVIAKYPNHKKAGSARKKLEKVEKKMVAK